MHTVEKAIEDLKTADSFIKKRHRYSCGLVSDTQRQNIGCGDFFFESPDGQNRELYYQLREMGYSIGGYSAEYYWKISKEGIQIAYTEGDITIKNLNK